MDDDQLVVSEFILENFSGTIPTFFIHDAAFLKKVVIRNSFIHSLSSCAFSGINSEALSIEIKNSIVVVISSNAFSDINKVDTILITSSNIGIINSHAFSRIHTINYLTIEEASIGIINSEAFSYIVDFRNIEIRSFDITQLNNHAFSKIESVAKISIHDGVLLKIDSDFFNANNCKLFEMYNMYIEEMHPYAFSRIRMSKFTMHDNFLQNMYENAFDNVTVGVFKMYHNQIATMSTNSVGINCRTLYFYENLILELQCSDLHKTGIQYKERHIYDNYLSCNCSLNWILEDTNLSNVSDVIKSLKCLEAEIVFGNFDDLRKHIETKICISKPNCGRKKKHSISPTIISTSCGESFNHTNAIQYSTSSYRTEIFSSSYRLDGISNGYDITTETYEKAETGL